MLTVVAACGSGADATPSAEPTVESRYSAEALYAEYEADAVAADRKFRGQTLTVIGVIESIGRPEPGHPFLTLSTGREWGVQCFPLAKTDARSRRILLAQAQLFVGKQVTIIGTGAGIVWHVILSDCGVTDPSFGPGPTVTPGVVPTTVDVATESAFERLIVDEGQARIPEYVESEWNHWIDEDRDCQNTRHEVLIEESIEPVSYRDLAFCVVSVGLWATPYTNASVKEAATLDVAHTVPLKNAHVSGAWAWSLEKKEAYANHLSDPDHLMVVTPAVNRDKGAMGPDEWRPPDRSSWCEYARDWVRIKTAWALTVTGSELFALQEMLETCGADG